MPSSSKGAKRNTSKKGFIKFRGAQSFRHRIVCATLSGKRIRIDDIRTLDEDPGLNDHEESFLRLVETISNGSAVEINETGTTIKYQPGIITGGKRLTHDCATSRSIGYYLEGLICLAPFAKKPLEITLTGVTNEDKDTSVDLFRTVAIPLLKRFGVDDVQLQIVKRGAWPGGGGEVKLRCPIVRQLQPINFTNFGMIKRIRGLAYATKISASNANRAAVTCKGKCNYFLPDVWIYTDHYPKSKSGASPGYGISIVAETTTGCLIASEKCGHPGTTPEDIAKLASDILFQEIAQGGCVDSCLQVLVLLMMVICPEDVSRVRLGELTPYTINFLRLVKQMFGVVFKIREDDAESVILSCQGVGFKNYAKSTA